MSDAPRDKVATDNWWNRLTGWYVPANGETPVLPNTGAVDPATRSQDQVTNSMAAATSHSKRASPSSEVVAGYTATSAFDELLASDGAIRPHWHQLLAGLQSLSHEQRIDRIERINLRVRETGIAHDVFADPARNLQPWHLDLVPLIFPPETWQGIETAVMQRARLLEAMLADIYGPQATLARGLIPPQLLFSDPAYLRPCHDIVPSAGRIQFLAVDLARSVDGTWRVVDTHVETPAGIGYALANRTVLTHVSGDLFSDSKAMRLAPFFQQLQDSLAQRIQRPDPTIALLTPGPRHNDYFSHAYLARYLGYLLVEGEDLRAEKGQVFLKTIDGLHAIDLIVRSVVGASSDALELDPSGFLGPVGLVDSVRRRPNLVVNALGTAVVENRGLGSYLPQLCKELLGEDLAIWDVKKWWLGDRAVGRTVIKDLDRYFIRQAFEQTARPGRAAPARDPLKLSSAQRAALIAEIEFNGSGLVAEEKTLLGTTPSYGPNGLEPKPYAVRIFATAVPGGFAVMPGGLAMTVDPGASMALTAFDGASRDVWVLSNNAQPVFKSLWRPTIEAAQVQRSPRELPSRAADNLFWLGRYVERADWTLRTLRNCLGRMEDDSGMRQNLQLARALLVELLERDGAPPVTVPSGLDETRVIAHLSRALMTATDRAYALPPTLGHIHRIASLTRDRLSQEAWRTLNEFYIGRHWQSGALPQSIGESLDLIDAGLAAVAAFSGLTHENMTRNPGWSLLDIGRRITRARHLSRMLLTLFQVHQSDEDDSTRAAFALEMADCFITYRSRYRLNPLMIPVLDLLIVDENNPRSLGFQFAALSRHIDMLPQADSGSGRTEVQKLALSMLNDVNLVDIARLVEVDSDARRTGLISFLEQQVVRLPQLSDAITRRYFSVVEKDPKWVRARSRQET